LRVETRAERVRVVEPVIDDVVGSGLNDVVLAVAQERKLLR
jgi:hypothetical protein